jgi:hypothetical protein
MTIKSPINYHLLSCDNMTNQFMVIIHITELSRFFLDTVVSPQICEEFSKQFNNETPKLQKDRCQNIGI